MHQSHTRHCHTVTLLPSPRHIISSHLMTHSQLNCTVPDIWVGHLDVAAPERGIWNKCFYPFIYFDKKFICLISFPRADNYVNFCDICFALTDPAWQIPTQFALDEVPKFAGLGSELFHFYVTVSALPLVESIHEHRRQVKVEIELFPQDAVELLRPLRLVYPTFSADTRL